MTNIFNIPKIAPRTFYAVLIGAGAIAVLLTLAIGLQQSVWFDEAYSVRVSQSSWGELIRLTALDTHPPLYYMLLKIWAGLFGWGEGWLRTLSALCYGGSVVVAGLVIKRLFNAKIALGTLPFLLLAPLLIRYGFEIRAYALASLIGILATYAMVRACEKKGWSWWWALYAALVAAGMLSLYYTILLWVAHLIWLLSRTSHSPKQLLRAPWVRAYGLSIVLFLPWLPSFMSQLGNGALAPISQAMTLDNIIGVLTFNTLYKPVWQLDALYSLVALFAISMIVWLVIRARRLVKASERAGFQLLLLYALVPVAMITLLSLISPMYVERYLSHVAIGVMMLIGVSANLVWLRQPHRTRTQQLLIVGLVAVLSLGVTQLMDVGNFNFQRLQKPEVRAATAVLKTSDELVVANDPYVMTELGFYLPDDRLKFFSEWFELGGGYAPLSQSNRRLDPANFTLPDQLTYAYYGDEPVVDLTEQGYKRLSVDEYGAMKIARYVH